MVNNILLLIALFVVPVILLYFKVIPFRYKIHVLAFVAIVIGVIEISKKWSMDKLGLGVGAVSNHWLQYVLFTFALVILVFVFARLLRRKRTTGLGGDTHFLYGFILVSILQEFIFRGFLIPELQTFIASPLFVILVNAVLFAFMHIIYADDALPLVGIFLGGIGFAAMYVYFPSLILVMIAHAILNFLVVYFGFFSQERQTRASPGV